MLERLKIHLAPPIFEGDEDKTRIAGFLNSMLIATLLMGLIFVPIGALTQEGRPETVSLLGELHNSP